MNEVREHKPGGYLYIVSFVCVLVGGIASVLLMLYDFRRNPSNLLRAFFILWVSAPFVLLFFAQQSKRWTVTGRAIVICLVLLLTASALANYSYVLANPPRSQGAFAFIVFPPITTVLLVMALVLIKIRYS